ncbi:hypothetical protein GCK72_015537 [Caenorhabditis remanei]|uniref:DUF7154 domain-containing protein n=1 Tax=Caenorhabditis remanei TaxID=31234 RepID=A0A6A5GV87_CAERE|nr:hypothetical protein GCK72_015537 [Caenorhabditis remanei]KAF1759077.1 hypothetical protein GCK72_015537 [Caenorhabditis remanei]
MDGWIDLYGTMANVRLDTKEEEEIEYHTDWKCPSTGSITWIWRHNNWKQLVQRVEDESDVSDIIKQLRANHVIVNIAVDSIPSGGSNSATLYEMSFQTNGYCVFATGSDLSNAFSWMFEILGWPFQFIASNFVVFGSGRIEIPAFKTPVPPPGETVTCLFAITVQNHTLDNSFVSMNYTIESTDGSDIHEFPSTQTYPLYGTAQSTNLVLYGYLSYKWTIDYHYNTVAPQIIECRMYSGIYHDFVPLPDFK